MDALELMLLLPTGTSKRLTQSQRKGGRKQGTLSLTSHCAPLTIYEEKERERARASKSGECPRALPERIVDINAGPGSP